MTVIYHQLGFRSVWSLTVLREDGIGDGVICAPRYQKIDEIRKLRKSIRSSSLFDPQFFIPATARGALETYPFFPTILSGGFDTEEYDSHAAASAELCVKFQDELGFRNHIIPTRIMEGLPRNYIEEQTALFVEPFVKAAGSRKAPKPLLLQLILTELMLRDETTVDDLLNWITGIDAIGGAYIIPYVTAREKQLQDPEALLGLMRLISGLRLNGMAAVVGYTNTEALLLLAADPTGVGTGCYENLRMFSPKAFEEKDGSQQRGPTARVFCEPMLQWIDNRYLGAITRALKGEDVTLVGGSPYRATMLNPKYQWHFMKSEPYKHYFHVFMPLLSRIGSVPVGAKRNKAIRKRLEEARRLFRLVEGEGVILDPGSNGDHVSAWLTALSQFEKLAT